MHSFGPATGLKRVTVSCLRRNFFFNVKELFWVPSSMVIFLLSCREAGLLQDMVPKGYLVLVFSAQPV